MNNVEKQIVKRKIEKLEKYKKELVIEQKNTIRYLIKCGLTLLGGAALSLITYNILLPFIGSWVAPILLLINTMSIILTPKSDCEPLLELVNEKKKVSKKLERLKSESFVIKRNNVRLMSNEKRKLINELQKEKRIILNNTGYIDPRKRNKVYGK